MVYYSSSHHKHCRWCGKSYTASKPVGRDGFHSAACKMAHHRAYKKYVTGKKPAASDIAQGPGRVRSRKKRAKVK